MPELDPSEPLIYLGGDVASSGKAFELEVRVGAAMFPEHGNTAEGLLRNAELAIVRVEIEFGFSERECYGTV